MVEVVFRLVKDPNQKFGQLLGAEPFDPDADHRRPFGARERESRVEICVEGHNDCVLMASPIQIRGVISLGETHLADVD